MNSARPGEKGQIIIMFVFAMVGLLGFTALAIDGGMVFSDRRFDQSVADAAALSGSGAASVEIGSISSGDYDCSHPAVIQAMNDALDAAIARAADNGFTGPRALLRGDLSSHHGVEATCSDSEPKHVEVHVELSSVTNTSLIHVITGQEEVPITVQSRVRTYARSSLVPGAALVGLSPYCENNPHHPYGVNYNGGVYNMIDGGGIFSNGGVTAMANSATIIANSLRTVDSSCGGGDGFEGPDSNLEDIDYVSTNAPPMTIDFDPIDCTAVPEATSTPTGGGTTWSAGRHESLITGSGVLEPGLHCLMDGLKVNGGEILTGENVTLVMYGGEFDTSGMGNTGTVTLLAPVNDSTGTIPGIPGMLLYVHPDNPDNEVNMMGNTLSVFRGTVYNPEGETELGGNPSAPTANYATQIISWNIILSGNAEVNMLYNENEFYQYDAYIDQFK